MTTQYNVVPIADMVSIMNRTRPPTEENTVREVQIHTCSCDKHTDSGTNGLASASSAPQRRPRSSMSVFFEVILTLVQAFLLYVCIYYVLSKLVEWTRSLFTGATYTDKEYLNKQFFDLKPKHEESVVLKDLSEQDEDKGQLDDMERKLDQMQTQIDMISRSLSRSEAGSEETYSEEYSDSEGSSSIREVNTTENDSGVQSYTSESQTE